MLPFTARRKPRESMYPIVCKHHKEHCEDCAMCRNFDQAVQQSLVSFKPHPSQHSTVMMPRIKAWIDSVFPVPIKS